MFHVEGPSGEFEMILNKLQLPDDEKNKEQNKEKNKEKKKKMFEPIAQYFYDEISSQKFIRGKELT